MRVGIIGTGAIARKHAQAYKNIGYEITVCTNTTAERGLRFAEENGAEFVETPEAVCWHPRVDYVDVCTFPNYRLQALELCAQSKKHVLVQKPMATRLDVAEQMIVLGCEAGIILGVVSQHRFDGSILFLKKALVDGRLGKILQADAYVKWFRSAEYYSRPVKGSWAGEGGGALINQAIHQIDLLLFLIGGVDEVFGYWQLGSLHNLEAEDSLSALMHYACGATGVLQATTSLWPGYPERLEIHGTKGTAIITGDQLTSWDVQDDVGETPPLARQEASGASDPMAISITPFERQFLDFGEACKTGRSPACSGADGYRALQLVQNIYRSCLEKRPIGISPLSL
ncbi:Gfo/Idh/MocA family oxidoreductase [Edaphobacter paludis]|uniref:Gfo/Idh/MocA family oxidoreductase n=1 Tax=Edaphobacter paludis TaxID=3035702 RepID=A0AAU7D3N7_9BACT